MLFCPVFWCLVVVGFASCLGATVLELLSTLPAIRRPVRASLAARRSGPRKHLLPPARITAPARGDALQCGNQCPSEGLIRERLSRAAPALRIHRFGHLATIYREELAQPRAMATLGFVFGTLALVVAARRAVWRAQPHGR